MNIIIKKTTIIQLLIPTVEVKINNKNKNTISHIIMLCNLKPNLAFSIFFYENLTNLFIEYLNDCLFFKKRKRFKILFFLNNNLKAFNLKTTKSRTNSLFHNIV